MLAINEMINKKLTMIGVIIMVTSGPVFSALLVEGYTTDPDKKAHPITVTVGNDQLRGETMDPHFRNQISVVIYAAPWKRFHLLNQTQKICIDAPMGESEPASGDDMIVSLGRQEKVGSWLCDVYQYNSNRSTEEWCLADPTKIAVKELNGDALSHMRSVLEMGWARESQDHLLAEALKAKGLGTRVPLRITRYLPKNLPVPTTKIWEFEVRSISEKSVSKETFEIPIDFKHVNQLGQKL